MQLFLDRHRDRIQGFLSGFDRPIFRGSLLSISYAEGMDKFVGACGVRYVGPAFLNAIARRVNPWVRSKNPLNLRPYYWTMKDSEYATDVSRLCGSRQVHAAAKGPDIDAGAPDTVLALPPSQTSCARFTNAPSIVTPKPIPLGQRT
jgi:hypothetical protein